MWPATMRRAENEVGLILTEGTTIRRGGASNDPNVPNFHEADSLAGWKNVVGKVHAKGGKIAPQIWHMGMVRKVGSGPNPDAPTDSPSGMTHTGRSAARSCRPWRGLSRQHSSIQPASPPGGRVQ